MAELEELPARGNNTPEYVAVQRSSTLIGAAIEAIRGEFVGEAHSSGLIPSRTPGDLMAAIQSEVSHNPVNYYVLQYVLANLNMGDRFKESIRSMKKVYLGKHGRRNQIQSTIHKYAIDTRYSLSLISGHFLDNYCMHTEWR